MTEHFWTFNQKTPVTFGWDGLKNLSCIVDDLKLKNGLLITSAGFVKNGLAGQIQGIRANGIADIFSSVLPDPDDQNVDRAAAAIQKGGHGFVVALGGGSVIDCAKAASAAAKTGSPCASFFKAPPTGGLPTIAIPTTAGTGSEVTGVSVVTDSKTGIKRPIVSSAFYPVWTLADPKLTLSMSARLTAVTGIDALSHALESFWSVHHQPTCDALAAYSARRIFQALRTAASSPNDRQAREHMSAASVMAGMAFNLAKTAAVHACSYPLSARFGLPHGEACGLTLDYFTRINADSENGRLNAFARDIGLGDANHMADEIGRLKRELGLLTDLKAFCVDEVGMDALVQESKHPNIRNNPVPVTDHILTKLYQSLT